MPGKHPPADKPEQIEQAIHVDGGPRVMLDSELARRYGVTTTALRRLLATPGELVEQIRKRETA
jgi:hypothetical protein